MTIFADVSTEGKPLITRVIGNTMSVTDPITGKQTAKLLGHEGQIVAAVFLPHQRIVSASLDGTLRVWNLMANHDPVMELKSVSGDLAGAAYFAASGKLVVTAPKRDQYMNFDNNGIAIWDAASGKHIRAMADEASRATSPLMKELIGDLCDVDISPDGERMATVHVDYNPGSGRDEEEPKPSPNYTPVRVWNTQSGKLLFALSGYRRGVRTARFSPDGNRLLTFADGGRRYAVIRDGKRYAAGSGGQMQAKVDVWDAQTGAHVRNIVPETAGGGHFALWTPDGKRILTNALYHVHNVAADIYDADTGARVAQLKHDLGSMDRATFSADGKLLLGRRNNILKGQLQVDIWETETGTKRTSLRGHTGEITSAHFSPDGKSAITTSMDGTARIWNVATGETVRHLRGHRHSVVSGRYSPDGKWVVTASTDGTAKVWDARTGVEWMSLAVPQAEMHGAEFDKDSQSVLTISSDGVARIWPLDPWPLAKSRKPRELSAEEKAQFHVD
jgi:WD40 repeat protein